MKCRIEKSALKGQVACPPNKSYTHRAIFLASLAGNSKVENVLFSDDTNATIDACRKFGAEITVEDLAVVVKSPIRTDVSNICINAENSGTTIRIASGIAGLYSDPIALTGDSSLQKRPMQPLLDALQTIGAQCDSADGKPPITIKGKITGGDVSIPGNFSSQFVSSLLISAPLTEKGICLSIDGGLVSKPYLDATIATMRKFGVSVQTLIPYKKYNIAPQIYKESTFEVPIDFSSLALLLSAAVLNGDVTIQGNIGNLPQGDEVFLDILEQMGVAVSIGDDEKITIKSPQRLGGGTFDLSNSPDLLPPLAVLALNSEPIKIINVKHARLKETDRIAIISRELQKLGISVQENEDGMILESPVNLRGAELNSENDHRLFMMFCIAGMYVGNCTITDAESVSVSYPDFVADMKSLGAKIHTD